MKVQNFKNHGRLVTGFHFVAGGLILLLLIGSIINVIKSTPENIYSALLLFVVTIIIVLITYYTRAFALKAQDRAIKAEENFRHYLLTGKPLSSDLKMAQIIALRFASNEEFPELTIKTIKGNLSQKEIKKSIENWKADTYRV